ncbi:class I SAM-dependent methyltransferase [Aquibacillus kalidii]|uniref:class I SAM-dependent methyltransferase n=1 Tax=Aquibacillus kalidii TaxID=2762597 RepID=UPI0016469A2F|nr:class I SAM-dependent methyltransferase [Aquibacillus kalidii]
MTGYRGPDAYNDKDFLKSFIHRRNRPKSPNNIIEKPIFIELLGDVKGKEILDLGCGDANFAVELVDQGYKSYLGIEGSSAMYEKAQSVTANLESANVQYSPIEKFDYPKDAFDMVTSRLVFHYIEDLLHPFHQIFQTLHSGGKFIFSVQHPILTSSTASLHQSGKRTNWIVDDYFYQGERVEPWIDQKVVKYHRTLEDYFKLLTEVGFSVESIREPRPEKEKFDTIEEYHRRMRIPLFLIFSCTKKA